MAKKKFNLSIDEKVKKQALDLVKVLPFIENSSRLFEYLIDKEFRERFRKELEPLDHLLADMRSDLERQGIHWTEDDVVRLVHEYRQEKQQGLSHAA